MPYKLQSYENKQQEETEINMKILKETFFERIQNRMMPENAIRVITRLQKASANRTIDYMDLKEASEMLARYRTEARIAIRTYRRWQSRQKSAALLAPLQDQQGRIWENRQLIAEILEPHTSEEGRILLQQARAQATLYLNASCDYRDLFELAMRPYVISSNDR